MPAYLLGICSSLLYIQYLGERKRQTESSATQFFEALKFNAYLRYFLYLLGISCITVSIVWQQYMLDYTKSPSHLESSLYSNLSFPIFTLGLIQLILPALVGKAGLIRFLFGSKALNYLCQASTGYYYVIPMIQLFYYCHTRHSIEFSYYMEFYYFSGNIVFGTCLYLAVLMLFDRSLYALYGLKRDISNAEKSQFYNLESYLSRFKPGQIVEIYSQSMPEDAKARQNLVEDQGSPLFD